MQRIFGCCEVSVAVAVASGVVVSAVTISGDAVAGVTVSGMGFLEYCPHRCQLSQNVRNSPGFRGLVLCPTRNLHFS